MLNYVKNCSAQCAYCYYLTLDCGKLTRTGSVCLTYKGLKGREEHDQYSSFHQDLFSLYPELGGEIKYLLCLRKLVFVTIVWTLTPTLFLDDAIYRRYSQKQITSGMKTRLCRPLELPRTMSDARWHVDVQRTRARKEGGGGSGRGTAFLGTDI